MVDFYHSDFSGTENPISESGAWQHTGLDWTVVATSGGLAFGTQTGSHQFDDSYAYLPGFPSNVTVSAVVHKSGAQDPSSSHEVEILLRWADSAHVARGYECNLAWNGAYSEIVRWNGPLGDFTYVTPQGSGGPGVVNDGDIFSATIKGNIITTFLNGVQLATADITAVSGGGAVWTDGSPGVGFYRTIPNSSPANGYCFTSYTAETIGGTPELFFGSTA